jgi:predicted nucleic acid-binding protein
LSAKALEELFFLLTQEIETVPIKNYAARMNEALKIAPHKEDAPYLALALAYNIAIWTNDKGIHAQSCVKVYTTKEIVFALGKR